MKAFSFTDWQRLQRIMTAPSRRPKSSAGTLSVSTVNTSLRALRRVLRLACEWGVISSAPKIRLLSDEQHRDRVITQDEETKYLAVAGEPLASIAIILADTGLRPDECYQPRWGNISFENLQRYSYGSLSEAWQDEGCKAKTHADSKSAGSIRHCSGRMRRNRKRAGCSLLQPRAATPITPQSESSTWERSSDAEFAHSSSTASDTRS